jgi:hypothetical protein
MSPKIDEDFSIPERAYVEVIRPIHHATPLLFQPPEFSKDRKTKVVEL